MEKIRQTGLEGGHPSQAGVPAGDVPRMSLGTGLLGTLVPVGLGQPWFSLLCRKVMGERGGLGAFLGAAPASAFSLSLKNVCCII